MNRIIQISKLTKDEIIHQVKNFVDENNSLNIADIKSYLNSNDTMVRFVVLELAPNYLEKHEALLDTLLLHYNIEQDTNNRRRIIKGLSKSKSSKVIAPFLLEKFEAEENIFIKAAIVNTLVKLNFNDWPLSILNSKEGPVASEVRKIIKTKIVAEINLENKIHNTNRPVGDYLLSFEKGLVVSTVYELSQIHNIASSEINLLNTEMLIANIQKPNETIPNLFTIKNNYFLIHHFHHISLSKIFTDENIKLILSKLKNILSSYPTVRTYKLNITDFVKEHNYNHYFNKFNENINETLNLIDTPKNNEIELLLLRSNQNISFCITAKFWEQPRQYEVISKISASINSIVAASLSILALINLKGKTPVRFIDPCCGAGTIIKEFSRFFPAAFITGIDISNQTIEIAKKNLSSIKANLSFFKMDFYDFTPPDNQLYDVVITNPPFGIRVKSNMSNAKLYSRLISKSLSLLTDNGILILHVADFRALGLNSFSNISLIKRIDIWQKEGMIISICVLQKNSN